MSSESVWRDPADEIDPDAVLYAVVRYLLAKGRKEAAHHLATAGISIHLTRYQNGKTDAKVALEGSVPFVDYFARLHHFKGDDFDTYRAIEVGFERALPGGINLERVEYRLLVNEVAEGWRQDILRELDGEGGHNQCATLPAQEVLVWRGLRFRSLSEMKIAEALDRARIMFFPNCRARLGLEKRGNLEADFLVCHNGTWGMLEVDGEPFHPPTRTVHDHERDRPFIRHGVKLIQHYDATRCRSEPDKIVAEFLVLLEKVRE